MKKFNFNNSALDLVNYVESVQSTFWQAEQGNFPNTWGGVNALTKRVVKDILNSMDLPYSKELGSYIRFIVTFEYTNRYIEYKRSIVGLTIEDVVFGDLLIMFKIGDLVMKQMTFSELVNMGVTVFYIKSYGYQECGIFGGWQPFGNKARFIKFRLDSDRYLVNSTFMIEDDVEPNDLFNEVDGKWVSVSDYDLIGLFELLII